MIKRGVKQFRPIYITIYLLVLHTFIYESNSVADKNVCYKVDGLAGSFYSIHFKNVNFAPDELSMELHKAAIDPATPAIEEENEVYTIKPQAGACTTHENFEISKINDDAKYASFFFVTLRVGSFVVDQITIRYDAALAVRKKIHGIFETAYIFFKTASTKKALGKATAGQATVMADLEALKDGQKYCLTFMNYMLEKPVYIVPTPESVFKLKKYVLVEIVVVDAALKELKNPPPIKVLVQVTIATKTDDELVADTAKERKLFYSSDLATNKIKIKIRGIDKKWIAKSIFSLNDAKFGTQVSTGNDFKLFGLIPTKYEEASKADYSTPGIFKFIKIEPELKKCQINDKAAYVIKNKLGSEVMSIESRCAIPVETASKVSSQDRCADTLADECLKQVPQA